MNQVEYAYYIGDEFQDIGTLEDLSKKFGVKKETIKFYSTNSYQRRIKRYDKSIITIKIESGDNDE